MNKGARAIATGLALTGALSAAVVYVSPDGSDSPGSGSESSPCATIQYAISNLQPGGVCRIKSGIYPETVRPAVDNITIEAIGPGSVVISGADRIHGWTVHSGDIWKAPISWDLGPTANQLFINGVWYHEARYPSVDDFTRNNCRERMSQRPNRCGDKEGIGGTFPEEHSSIMYPTTIPVSFLDLKDDLHKGYPLDENSCHLAYAGFGKELPSAAQNTYNIVTGKPRDYFKGASFWSQGWWWSGGGVITESWDDGGTLHFKVKTDRIR